MLQNIQCAFLSQCFGAVAANVAEASTPASLSSYSLRPLEDEDIVAGRGVKEGY
jgi:hypothetical protein